MVFFWYFGIFWGGGGGWRRQEKGERERGKREEWVWAARGWANKWRVFFRITTYQRKNDGVSVAGFGGIGKVSAVVFVLGLVLVYL